MPSRIPPELQAQLRTLRLRTRHGEGDGVGQHASRNHGAGLEFAQYRAYVPGDDPRRIDWKLQARSDRWFVREAERDSPLTLWLVLDASASMRQHDPARPDYSRLDAARLLAACAIELALRQGERFGLIALAPTPCFVPASAGSRQRDRCLHAIDRLEAAGDLPGPATLMPLQERLQPPALLLLLSDFFDDTMLELALRLAGAGAGRELATIQLLTAQERDFPFRGDIGLIDPESGDERRIDADSVRTEYLDRFAAARAALARRFAAAGIRHVEHVLDRPLHEPLHALFGTSRSRTP